MRTEMELVSLDDINVLRRRSTVREPITSWAAEGAAHLVFFSKPQQLRAYSAGTIGVSGRSSSRRNTGRRMLAMKWRSSLCTALGLRK